MPRFSTSDVADLLVTVRVRVLGYLARRGIITLDPEATVVPVDCSEREPALAQLAAASVTGLPPAGPEVKRRPPIPFPGVEIDGRLCVAEMGFTLHAATTCGARDERARAALVKYILRPPISEGSNGVADEDSAE